MGSRRVVNDYALPKRIFIGPTSMDAELAFIICNLAKVGGLSLPHALALGTERGQREKQMTLIWP
jgi:hypothetical protein